ncbi:S8 family serine peptidase [Ohtaekwangia koreensis]|uniref:Subtilase family protein n=1 Tax=Ohtaekwangia koreensis TaxID=688867 RepID=A0A1T5M536_9BACT|nr:S8 family serine peptidase [Ohtaekwangia koreensis]SKC83320.1 Subtilase family protein [Ohtaekwangia koreensis]
MEEIGVAIIDQGVDFSYHRLTSSAAAEEVTLPREAGKAGESKSMLYHGTNVASIIHYLAPASRIISIRLDTEKITVDLLCRALEYCAQRKDVHIINISLGIVRSSPPEILRQACMKCYHNGQVVIAAAHHETSYPCYPAAFPTVIGVGTGIFRRMQDFCYVGEGYINVLAKGIHQRIQGESGKPAIRSGTSYAAAALSGRLAYIYQQDIQSRHIPVANLLQRYSVPGRSTHYPLAADMQSDRKPLPEYIADKRWMLFAVDDECIQPYFEDPRVAMVMNYPMDPIDAYGALVRKSGKKVIPGIVSPKMLEFIDVLIVGNFFSNTNLINTYFGYQLIDFFRAHGKRIETTDPYIQTLLDGASVVATPSILEPT